jgi:hypothetical protein
MDDLKEILEAVIDHLYFVEQDHFSELVRKRDR